MDKLNLDKITLKKFGMTMGIAFLAILGWFFLQHKHVGALFSLLISCVFFVIGLISPVLLKPAYIIWMRFAFILGWINTRIILIILFYLVFMPLGLFLRLFGVDFLEIKKKEGSYWKSKEEINFDPKNYERRF